jgi:hypothetical protein
MNSQKGMKITTLTPLWRRCSPRQWSAYTHFSIILLLIMCRQLWTNGWSVGEDTSIFYWNWKVGPLLRSAQFAPLDARKSSALTVSEQMYFARTAASKCTKGPHSIDCFNGLEVIMHQHPCIHLALCYSLVTMGSLVRGQWRYVHLDFIHLYMLICILGCQSSAGIFHSEASDQTCRFFISPRGTRGG